MRILHVASSLDPRGGGVAEALRQFAPALERQGCENHIATLDAPGSPWLADFPASVTALGPTRTSYQYAAGLAPWLRSRRGDFDCLISHGLWQHHGFAAWRAWRGPDAPPRFVFAHGMLDPWFKRTYPKKHLKKWLYWPWAEYRLLREARAVFFTCEEERRRARESFWLYRCHEAIANLGLADPPADAERQKEAFFASYPHLRGKRFLLYLGRVHPKKGVDLLLTAAATCSINRQRDLQVVIAGPGEESYVAKMRQGFASVASQPVTKSGKTTSLHLTWTGMLTGDLKWGAFRAAEAFVLPSHQENFGIAVAEALACGCPVLISDKVNIWREIAEDGAGFVEADNLGGAVEMLRRWLELDAAERAAMAQRARACYEKRFQIDRAAAGLLQQLRAFGVRDGQPPP